MTLFMQAVVQGAGFAVGVLFIVAIPVILAFVIGETREGMGLKRYDD